MRAVFGCADFWFEVEGLKCRVRGIYIYELIYMRSLLALDQA